MSNFASNFFIIIVGFCLLGAPIILISMSTAPPTPNQYLSSIVINSVSGDSDSYDYLLEVANINGSSPDFWDTFPAQGNLSLVHNITELTITEADFTSEVKTYKYGGWSDLVHIFDLEMNISAAPTSSSTVKNLYANLFGNSNGTYLFWMWVPDDYEAYDQDNSYRSVNQTIDDVYSNYAIAANDYLVTITFYANLDINGTQMGLNFKRIMILDDFGIPLFFISNEADWSRLLELD